MRKYGLVLVGVAVGLVLVELLHEQEKKEAAADTGKKKNGLFAEICGNKVRFYEIKDGSFCGYSEEKVFESREKAMEWVVRETDAKIVFREEA